MQNKSKIKNFKSPLWIIEENLLEKNLQLLYKVKKQSNIKILLALKAYSLWKSFNLVSKYLDGCCSSGLYESKLAYEEFKKEVHSYSPAFKEEDLIKIAKISNHLIFNSSSQLDKFFLLAKKINPNISLGIRINPEYSKSPVEKYNPCSKYSRFGVTKKNFNKNILEKIDGFHLHSLCEANAEDFIKVLEVFENKFGEYLNKLKWVNFGGGHLITKEGYNIQSFISSINEFKKKFPHLIIYIELGEAVAYNTGVLVAKILDIIYNEMDIVILDISSESHMPDTIIMPYKAEIQGSIEKNKNSFNYKITGNSCLAGDIFGDYSFKEKLQIGDNIIFENQIQYTMVKANFFNGIKMPNISILRKSGELEIIKEFNYLDFKNKLS